MSNPDVYNKIVGLNGLQGLPTYEEHLILNGSKSSLQQIDREKNHDRDRGSNNQVNQNRYQQISHSKQSLQYRNGSLTNMFGVLVWRTYSCSRTFKRSNEGFFLPRNPNLKFQSHERLYELSPNEHNADGYQGFYGDGFTGHGHPSHLNNNPSSKQPANIPDYDYFVNQSNPEVFL